jgi:ATP-dependent Clp protease ATP-binding subunit ClpB
MLQLLDDGRITDSKGRTIDCTNIVLIMTSNIGARKIIAAAGDREKAIAGVMEELKRTVKPEFLNRIDDVIIFDSLTRGDMDFIFDIQMKRVKRLLAGRMLSIEVTAEARTALCDAGFDPAFGARPLKRAIQQYLLNPMSRAIVAGGYGPGDVVKVDAESGDEGVITFERIPAPEEDEDSDGDATNTTEPKAFPAPKGE